MKPNLNGTQLSALGLVTIVLLVGGIHHLSAAPAPLLNDPIDVSADFPNLANTLVSFDSATAPGKLSYQRSMVVAKNAFDNTLSGAKAVEPIK